jgi:VPDSG-CTERM motif
MRDKATPQHRTVRTSFEGAFLGGKNFLKKTLAKSRQPVLKPLPSIGVQRNLSGGKLIRNIKLIGGFMCNVVSSRWNGESFKVVLVVILGGLNFAVQATPAVWINEIHYDNSGSDVGEFVEVAGAAGTDLTGLQIVLYNGNGGVTYGSPIDLAGAIADQQNGFGTSWVGTAGIQNGPDAIALYDSVAASVLQFLSYEGSFMATDGPANGLTSTDIGVAETTSTSIGYSLQLIGAGSGYEDFVWSGPSAESPGAINANQSFLSLDNDPSTTPNGVPDAGSSLFLLSLAVSGLIPFRRIRQGKP